MWELAVAHLFLLFLALCMNDVNSFIIVTIYFYLALVHVLFKSLHQLLCL